MMGRILERRGGGGHHGDLHIEAHGDGVRGADAPGGHGGGVAPRLGGSRGLAGGGAQGALRLLSHLQGAAQGGHHAYPAKLSSSQRGATADHTDSCASTS